MTEQEIANLLYEYAGEFTEFNEKWRKRGVMCGHDIITFYADKNGKMYKIDWPLDIINPTVFKNAINLGHLI